MTIQLKNRQPAPYVSCIRVLPPARDGFQPAHKEPFVNLEHTTIHHSPDGFEWGYMGSGPADLALQILANCLPVGCDGLPPVKLWKGQCSSLAWLLHQDFKRDFIARLPREGGSIEPALIDQWLDEHLPPLLDDEPVIDESDAPELR